MIASLGLGACSDQSPAKAPDPTALLQAIPAADSAQYDKIKDMRNWRNPYLIVRAVVADPADRSPFDHWYRTEHLPDALKAFGAVSAMRGKWNGCTSRPR